MTVERVLGILSLLLDVPRSELSTASSTETVPGWDSSAQLNIGLAIEEEFGVELAPEELMSLQSVANIIAILESHQVQTTQ